MYQTTPTKMYDQRSTPIRKSKLVTISSTANDNDAFANLFPMFKYKGSSKTQKSEVEVSFPSYWGNLMFYEHYRESNFDSPYILSFMYLGKNTKGEISYNFQDYKTVEIAEFCKELQSVNLVFQVLNQLPKCREVKIYLDDENHLLSSEDSASFDRYNDFPCISNTVKVLRIVRISSNNDQSMGRRTRFTDIMKYAVQFLPNLEHLYVEGMDGGGTSYDLVNAFIKTKFMPRHNITIRDGRTFCEPQLHQPVSKPRKAIAQGDRNVPLNVRQPSNGSCSTGRKQPTLAPMKQETSEPKHVPESDLVIVPAPPKEPPVVLDTIIISDDENEASPPKKPRRDSLQEIAESRRLDAASPASTTSISSMATCVVSDPPIPQHSSSLTSILSSYNNDWESSSDDEREKLQNPVKPERKSTDPPSAVIKNELGQVSNNVGNNEVVINPNLAAMVPMNMDELRNILEAAKGVPPISREATEKVKPKAKPKKKEIFREGIHFDRRPNSSSHKRQTD